MCKGVLPILFAILPHSHLRIFFKNFSEMTLGGEAEISGDLAVRIRGVGQQIFGQLYFFS